LEIVDLGLIFGVLGVGSALLIFAINRLSPKKIAQRAGYEGIKANYEVYHDQVSDIIQLKDNQIKRLNAKIQSLEPIEEEGSTELPISEGLAALAKSKGIDPTILQNPLVKKYIKKYTKGMSIDEIASLVDQLGIFKKGSKPQQSAQEIGNNPNFF